MPAARTPVGKAGECSSALCAGLPTLPPPPLACPHLTRHRIAASVCVCSDVGQPTHRGLHVRNQLAPRSCHDIEIFLRKYTEIDRYSSVSCSTSSRTLLSDSIYPQYRMRPRSQLYPTSRHCLHNNTRHAGICTAQYQDCGVTWACCMLPRAVPSGQVRDPRRGRLRAVCHGIRSAVRACITAADAGRGLTHPRRSP